MTSAQAFIMTSLRVTIVFMAISVIHSSGESVNLELSADSQYIGNYTCEELLERYANTSANFIYCAVKHARPIRICESCVTSYQDVIKAHNDILQVEDGDGNKVCKENLMNLDRLEVIEDGFLYISNLWGRASCSYCFDANNETLQIKNSTVKFMDMLNVTLTCFANHSLGNDSYIRSVCVDCEKIYCSMNQFYDSLKNSQDNICMDIVDSMNVTRMLWNDKLKCKKEGRKMDVIYLACSCVVAAMPVLFYLSAGLFTTVIRNRLQMQKRLAEILRPSTSAEAT